MLLSRPMLYARLGVSRVRLPQYVNFTLPLAPDSPFGFRITAVPSGEGDPQTITRDYYLNGQSCTEAELNVAVMKARDHWGQMQSAKMLGAAIDGYDGPFPGVAFDYLDQQGAAYGA